MLSTSAELPVYAHLPLDLVSGRGATVTDAAGREYLDFYGGHAVAGIGHSHPRLVQALTEQAQKLMFYSNAVDFERRQAFCRELLRMGPDGMAGVFLCNSGAEANENALTLARHATGRGTYVTVAGGFHGRTLLTLSLAGLPRYRQLTETGGNPLADRIRTLPAHDTAAIEATVDEDCAAVIIEPVQGLAGAVAFAPEYLARLKARCDEVGAVLIFDEVQCGTGRSGRFTAGQRLGVTPHAVTLAKGLGGGFPLGAVLCDPRIAAAAKGGVLGSTFGGGPLASAAGLAVLSILEEEKLMANAETVGAHLQKQLAAIDGVQGVDGLGLLIGIRLPRPAGEVRDALLADHAVIAGTSADANVLRIMPPLGITRQQADRFVAALTQTLS